MTTTTAITLILLVAAAIQGANRGFVRQLGSVAAVVLAIIASRLLAHPVGYMLQGSVSKLPAVAAMVGGAVVYVAVWLGVGASTRILHRLTHLLMVARLDHLAGILFSVIKWAIAISIALNLLAMASPESSLLPAPWLTDVLMPLAPTLMGIVTARLC